MPRFEHLGVNPYTVPGLVPGLLGAIIALLGLALAARSLRAMASRAARPDAAKAGGGGWTRLAVCLGLTVGYAAGLIGRVPFWAATALFVFAFIVIFEWRPDAERSRRLPMVLSAAIQAAIVSAAVTLVFRDLFLVALP